MGFSFASEPQSLSSHVVTCKTGPGHWRHRGPDQGYSVLFWLFSELVPHMKKASGYVFFMVWHVEHDSKVQQITQQLSCPLNTHKTSYAVVAHDYCRVLRKGAHSKECIVKICLLSVWCHSFLNVKLFLSFYLAFFPSNSQMSRTGISYF